ncbi:MAG: hypothetical protein RLZ55_954 [Actinomycetota bacterium]
MSLRAVTARSGSAELVDVDLSVLRGEVHGIVGPVGSGKSTLVRVLVGLTRPASGTATVLGHDAWSDAVALQRRLAYAPWEVGMWPQLSLAEVVAFLHRVAGDIDEKCCLQRLADMGLEASVSVGRLSRSQQLVVGRIAALCRPVDVFVLDDCFTGLPEPLRLGLAASITAVHDRGATVVLTGRPEDLRLGDVGRFTRIREGVVRAPVAGAAH